MNFTELASIPSDRPVPCTDQLRLAVAACLARFKGSSRYHAESDLRSFLTWCAARQSANPCDFALVAMLGLLGLRIFEATGSHIADLGEEHGHRVLRVCGKGTKVVLIPLPPAVGRAIDQAIGIRTPGPILLNSRAARMDRYAATRRLRRLAEAGGVQITRAHPHMLGAHLRHHHARRRGQLAQRPDRRPSRRPTHHEAL